MIIKEDIGKEVRCSLFPHDTAILVDIYDWKQTARIIFGTKKERIVFQKTLKTVESIELAKASNKTEQLKTLDDTIIMLIAEGWCNREITQRLHIARKTLSKRLAVMEGKGLVKFYGRRWNVTGDLANKSTAS